MKPNGKMFAVRVVLFVVCAVGLFSTLAGAENVRGTFKLPVEAHWGGMVLVPGEYEFTLDTASPGSVITLRSMGSGRSWMVLSRGMSIVPAASSSSLELAESEGVKYVHTLYLKDAGVALNFGAPKAAVKLAKSTSPGTTSASDAN